MRLAPRIGSQTIQTAKSRKTGKTVSSNTSNKTSYPRFAIPAWALPILSLLIFTPSCTSAKQKIKADYDNRSPLPQENYQNGQAIPIDNGNKKGTKKLDTKTSKKVQKKVTTKKVNKTDAIKVDKTKAKPKARFTLKELEKQNISMKKLLDKRFPGKLPKNWQAIIKKEGLAKEGIHFCADVFANAFEKRIALLNLYIKNKNDLLNSLQARYNRCEKALKSERKRFKEHKAKLSPQDMKLQAKNLEKVEAQFRQIETVQFKRGVMIDNHKTVLNMMITGVEMLKHCGGIEDRAMNLEKSSWLRQMLVKAFKDNKINFEDPRTWKDLKKKTGLPFTAIILQPLSWAMRVEPVASKHYTDEGIWKVPSEADPDQETERQVENLNQLDKDLEDFPRELPSYIRP